MCIRYILYEWKRNSKWVCRALNDSCGTFPLEFCTEFLNSDSVVWTDGSGKMSRALKSFSDCICFRLKTKDNRVSSTGKKNAICSELILIRMIHGRSPCTYDLEDEFAFERRLNLQRVIWNCIDFISLSFHSFRISRWIDRYRNPREEP